MFLGISNAIMQNESVSARDEKSMHRETEYTMDQRKLKLTHTAILAVPVPAADMLLGSGSPEAVMLYLYMLRRGGALEMDAALRDLPMTQASLRAAADTLERLGLLASESGAKAPLPADELPEYEAADVVRRTTEDPAFLGLLEETQKVLGRVLTTADVRKLFGIYDDLALPAEVIMLLVNHCKEEHEYRYGAEKHLGFAAIEKEAYSWSNREIVTYEQAEQWLGRLAERRSQVGRVRSLLGIQGRNLAPTEGKYLDEWLELGFGPEEIALAADRTIMNTGELRWRYMNSIIQSWHKMDLHTVEAIERGDKKPSRRGGKQAAKTPAAPDSSRALEQMERLARLREQMKQN